MLHSRWRRAAKAILALALSGAGCSREAKIDAKAGEAAAPPVVAVAKASLEDISQTLLLTAEFRPFQEVDVMAKVAGYVKKINVDVGDRVQAGQVLALLEIPEMADDVSRGRASVERSQADVLRARDEVARAVTAHENAHLQYTRLRDVSARKPGLVAQQEVDNAQNRDLVSEAQVTSAKSALGVAEQQVHVVDADLKRSRTMLDYTSVTAPFAGVITKRYADNGAMVQAGTSSSTQAMPVARVSEISRLRLILPVPESAVPVVKLGQTMDVRVPSLSRSFPGRVARFSGKVQSATRTMDTEVDVVNPSLTLVPGMYAEVNLLMASKPHAVVVPVQAVQIGSEEGKGQAMVVTGANKIEIRTVKLGMQTASKLEVLDGVAEGEFVITGNRAGLKAGQSVEPKVTK